MTVWMEDLESRLTVHAWVQNHLRTLYAFAIFFGSAHSSVVICNSNLYQLDLFNMGLNRRQRAVFKNKRLFSTVLMEVGCTLHFLAFIIYNVLAGMTQFCVFFGCFLCYLLAGM